MPVSRQWQAEQTRLRRELYDRYGKALEVTHFGQYVAIGFDGQTIVRDDDGEVLTQAVRAFGAGNFVLARVGYPVWGKWLPMEPGSRLKKHDASILRSRRSQALIE